MVVILASIPWLLPWDELKVPYLPSFHVVASIAPWIGSTIYHLFMNHNTVFTVVDLTAPDLTGCTIGQLISKFLFGVIVLTNKMTVRISVLKVLIAYSGLLGSFLGLHVGFRINVIIY